MTLVAHPLGAEDDTLDAVQQLHTVLLDTETETPAYETYATAKEQVLEAEASKGQLHSFKIPTRIKLQPPLPKNADEIRSYLLDAIALVRAFRHHCERDAATTPFHFEALTLSVYTDYLCDVRYELRALRSLGVPVTISLRHLEMGWNVQGHWTTFQYPNMFSVVARNPGSTAYPPIQVHAVHLLESMWISRACEMWSSVAYSSTLRHVSTTPTPSDDEQVLRWTAFALAHSCSLQSLTVRAFQMHELDAFEAVIRDPVPSCLLKNPPTEPAPVQLIRFQPDAIIQL